MASDEDLLLVHTPEYLEWLDWSCYLTFALEVLCVMCFPSCLVRKLVLVPMLYATGGTIFAGEVALKCGWAINLSGGYHHAYSESGGGFCIYADISISIRKLQKNHPNVKKIMIIDLDAHQGNGHERDFMHDVLVLKTVYIFDLYSSPNYPSDYDAKRAISYGCPFPYNTNDATYMNILTTKLPESLNEFKPDIIYYNAGTDGLKGDPVGALGLSANCIIQRDQFVFEHAFKRNIPIVMVLSGGYQQNNARVIADSIINLDNTFHILSV